ncbi:D-2-hydroxyacid dehydrogenase [Virgibacillus byunsanensis]|uniref:D-2-hydroxyacid dehydrogenase n=1 Tax=Virgibacillus byunsanensis TaxID=570945 RepID=A0ABW3LNV1_9BACI
MVILFSANISKKHQEKFTMKYPDHSFVFCKNMDEAKSHLKKAEILVTFGEDLTSELIDQATDLKWIMVISAGMDQMPFKSIQERGIIVTNAKGIHKIPMAEYAISMLLQVYRQEKVTLRNQQNSEWVRGVKMQEITGKTMLVAGTGAIGQEVARLAKAFQMKTYGVSRSGRSVEYFDENYTTDEMERVLPEVDFVVSILPSTPETKYLFNYNHFEKLPNHAVFLNMGRGDVVQSDDVLKAVQQGEIAHAVLDVFHEEPLPRDHPFWQEENVTVTPHLSGISPKYISRALDIFDKNLQTYKNNRDDYINEIDVTRGY